MHLLFLFAALTCPPLDQTTVEGALGKVELAVTEKTCVFTNGDYQLKLQLTKLSFASEFAKYSEKACQEGHDVTAVKAIGNEAVACTVEGTDKIIARVRNHAFTLSLTATEKKPLREINHLFAEQVAGNLF